SYNEDPLAVYYNCLFFTAATRMIANALSHDSPPATPARRPVDNRLSVTVSNSQATKKAVVSQPADEGKPSAKRRRVTAEMEGKYIINMPKGTTPRTRRILAQQAKKGRPDPVVSPTA
ncbi:hypothetical protein GOODEAATRI_018997, partial [Goodea atripinnis]